jgi:hypothetical protein
MFPRVRMNNSYDGSVKYSFSFGFYRLVCSNGLSVPIQGLESRDFKLRHTPGTGSMALQKTMDAIDIFVEKAPEVIKAYNPLVKKTLSWEAALKRIEEVIEDTPFPKKKAEDVIRRLEKEKEMGFIVNDFLIYNALNHTLYQGESRMKTHKQDKVDAKVLNYLLEN